VKKALLVLFSVLMLFSFVLAATYSIGKADGVQCSVEVTPSPAGVDNSVTIKITPSTWLAGASDRKIELYYEDPNGSGTTKNLTSQTYTFTPDKVGDWDFRVKLKWRVCLIWCWDEYKQKEFTLKVEGNQKPVANFTYQNTTLGTAPDRGHSTLDASASYDPDGSIAEYVWTFNAGAPITHYKYKVYNFTWAYDTAPTGTFEADIPVTLTVKDNEGATGTITKTVHVIKKCDSPGCGGCDPKNCSEIGWECGTGTDNCGDPIDCGDCPTGETCQNHQCISCIPKTCSQMGWECGSGTENRCDTYLSCPTCPSGESCVNKQCVPDCVPKTCSQMGWACGTGTENNCDQTISCNPCPTGQSCVNHQCEPDCIPRNCSGMGWACGVGHEICGNSLDCGDCPTGETCSNHDCICSPKNCAQMGLECGSGTEDRCNSPLNCGGCPTGEKCENNQCVPICVPKTCAQMGWQCDPGTEDKCGTAIDCGSCAAGEVCSSHSCCTPSDCTAMGWECGTGNETACGTGIDCGPCPGGEVCQSNACCTPKTCTDMGWECDIGIETNCNTSIDCGLCPAGEICANYKCDSPPKSNFSASPSNGFIPLTVTFDASSTNDPDGDTIDEYTWTFSDMARPWTHDQSNFDIVFTNQGTVMVTLEVRAGTLTDSKSRMITIQSMPASIGAIDVNKTAAGEKALVKVECNQDIDLNLALFKELPGGTLTTIASMPSYICNSGYVELGPELDSGIYMAKAEVKAGACSKCTDTKHFVVTEPFAFNIFAPEIHPALAALAAFAVLIVARRKR